MFTATIRTSVLTNFVTLLRSRKKIALSCICRIQRFSSTDTGHEKKSLIFGANYTTEQQDAILTTINTSTVDELKRYSITEARIKKLTAYRDRYGPFKNISEILLMQGIEISVLDRFCKSIVKGPPTAKNKSVNTKGDLLTPPLTNEVRTAINTFTGIWVCGSVISWAQVDRGCNLLDWKCECLQDVAMKDGLVAVVESVASVVSKVPMSHAYIMEGEPIIPFSRMNSVAYYLQLQRQQIVSTIVSLLGTREPRFGGSEFGTFINNIYMMRSRTPARLFNLLIGSETVSSGSVVENIIDGDDNDIIHIRADSDARESYKLQNNYQPAWKLLRAKLTPTFTSGKLKKMFSLMIGVGDNLMGHLESLNLEGRNKWGRNVIVLKN